MGKLPFMKFFPGDFDRDMISHSLEIRGAWITIINHLWNNEPRGSASHNIIQWSRILGNSEEEANRIILYLQHENIASCNIECNGNVTVSSRRILREDKERENTRLRVAKLRSKDLCNINVTTLCNGNVTPKKLEVRSQKSEVIKRKDLKELLLEHIKTYSEAYPGIDLESETSKAEAWLLSNPKNKKSNLKRYLNNWFARAQDQINKYPPREEKYL